MPNCQSNIYKIIEFIISVCKLAKGNFFVQLITDRLQNKEKFELKCVWCNLHFNNIGTINYYVITQHAQMYIVPSWEILSPILLSTSTSESSSKSEAFTKKEKKLTAQKKNMKWCKVSVAILII